MNIEDALGYLSDPGIPLDELDLDSLTGLAGRAVEGKENYYVILGKIASQVSKRYGKGGLEDFAKMIVELTGKTVSINSLRNYRWVWEKVGPLDPPRDMSYKAWRYLARCSEPSVWLTKAIDNGWSDEELVREIRLEYELDKTEKTTVCPHCGGTL